MYRLLASQNVRDGCVCGCICLRMHVCLHVTTCTAWVPPSSQVTGGVSHCGVRAQSLDNTHTPLPQRCSSSVVRVSDQYSEGPGFESQLDPDFSVDLNGLTQCLNCISCSLSGLPHDALHVRNLINWAFFSVTCSFWVHPCKYTCIYH